MNEVNDLRNVALRLKQSEFMELSTPQQSNIAEAFGIHGRIYDNKDRFRIWQAIQTLKAIGESSN